MSEPLGVSILIPAYNEELLISQVLRRVRESFAALEHRFYEIIVCDNNSTDATARLAAENGARVVHEPHNQISRARNAAARAASHQWLIFLDADSFITPELLAETLGCFASGRVCGGGSILKFDRPGIGVFASCLTWVWNRVSRALRLAAGSYVFCSARAWREIGGFDEQVYAGEEIWFSRKLKNWGRAKGLRFEVLIKAPIETSARKMDWYGPWQLVWRVLLMARPGALRDRKACGLWYTRPEKGT